MLHRLRAYGRSAAFGTYASAMLTAYEINHRQVDDHARPALAERYKRRVGRDLLNVFGLDWAMHGAESESGRGQLVVANHRSALDIGVMLAQFGGSLLSRGDLAEWPIVGKMAQHGGTIFVDRDDRKSGVQAIRAIRSRLKAGATVIVFPEGTTYAGDEVQPFQRGTFAAAKGLDVDIVPVGLAYHCSPEWVNRRFGEHILELAGTSNKRLVGHIGERFRAGRDTTEMANRSRDSVQNLVRRSREKLSR